MLDITSNTCPLLASHPVDPDAAMDFLWLIFKSIIVIVFFGMNILYRLFWKNSAQADYFESMGVKEAPAIIVEKEQIVVPKTDGPHHCHCGYNLGIDLDRWLPIDIDTPARCPKCEREILLDELDLTPPVAGVSQEKSTVASVEVAVQPPPQKAPEPSPQPAVEEMPLEVEALEPLPEEVEEMKEAAPEKSEPEVEMIGIGT